MANELDDPRQKESYLTCTREEKGVLGQMAKLLVREKLISPQEQLRFLALLKEEV